MNINRTESLIIEQGNSSDIDELEKLYDDLNDYLAATVNYPGWIKGIYPVRESALSGLKDDALYVARYHHKIVGSVVLNHEPEEAYEGRSWNIKADYSHIFVLRTFVVHPTYLKMGVGQVLIDFSIAKARQTGMKSIRLDVFEKNIPAIALYEKNGFKYIETVDLGLAHYGLDWFRLYEKTI